MQQAVRRPTPRASVRRLVLAGLTAFLTGILLGLAGPAGAVNAPLFTSAPPALGNDTAVTWSWTADPAATTTCSLTTPGATRDVGACTSPWSTTLVEGDGTYTLVVTAHLVNTAGVTESAPSAPSSTVLDTQAPAVSITSSPISPSTARALSWDLAVEQGAAVTGSVAGPGGTSVGAACTAAGTAATCTADLTGQPEGSWTLTAAARDAAGNIGTVEATPYVLDVAPAAPVVTAAASPSNDTTPAWTFEVPTGASALCSLAGPTSILHTDVACASGWSPALTDGDGLYTASVVLQDGGGRSDAGTASYTLDTTAPAAVTTVSGPSGRSADNTPDWTFDAPLGTSALCTLVNDGTPGVESACTSPHSPRVADGVWQLSVVLVDQAGNRSAATSSARVTVDTTPPPAPVLTAVPVSPNNGGPAQSFTWNWQTQPDTIECQVRSGPSTVVLAWQTCAGGSYTQSTAALPDGPVSLDLRSSDDLLNRSAVVTSTVTLDVTAPAPAVISGSSGSGTATSAAWSWAQAADERATCRLLENGTPTATAFAACTSADSWALARDGEWSLQVELIDPAGNTSTTATGPVYRLDRVAPAAPGIDGPFGPGNEPAVTWTVSGEPDATVACRLLRDGVLAVDWASCGRSVARTLTSDGSWVLQATLTDAAGNTSFTSASAAYDLDTFAPAQPIVSGPTGPSSTTTVTWTWTGDTTAAASCRLLRGVAVVQDWARCSASETVLLSGDGGWTWQVRLTDAAGNASAIGNSPVYQLDTTAPPAPGVTGPTGPNSSRSPQFTVTGEAGAGVECRVLRGTTTVAGWSTCARTYTADLTGQPDGGYTVQARLVDAAGNVSGTTTSAVYVLDTTAPDAPTVIGTSGAGQNPIPSWSWASEAGSTSECRLIQGGVAATAWAACSAPWTPTLPSEGDWSAQVRVTDAAGNLGLPGTGPAYRYDVTAPAAPTVTAPASPGSSRSPSWTFAGEAGSTATCRLVGPDSTSAWATCISPHTTSLTGRPQGPYTLEVIVTDAAGNSSLVGSATYVLDTVAPLAPTVEGPTGPASSRSPQFTFAGEAGTTAACTLLRGTTVVRTGVCTSPTTLDLSGLGDATYTLSVRLTDAAGNEGAAGTADYQLDTTAPQAPAFTVEPATSFDRTPTWEFTAEAGATLLCRVTAPDGTVAFDGVCTSPFTPTLSGPDGTYALTVVARDRAGNLSAGASSSYLLDTAPPPPVGITGPASPGSGLNPTWILTTPGTHECRLDGPAGEVSGWSSCADSYTAPLAGLGDGTYVVTARTWDEAGNVSAEARSAYRLDTIAPTAPVLTGPAGPSSDRMPAFTFTGEAGATATCTLLRGSTLVRTVSCVSPATVDLTGLPDATYTLAVRLVDAAGNVSDPTSTSYLLDTTAPARPVITREPPTSFDRTPTWEFTAETGATLLCRVTAPDGTIAFDGVCTSPFDPLLSGPDGTYALTVVARDAAGNRSEPGTSSYLLDTTPPAAVSVTAPASPGSGFSPTWTLNTPGGHECRLDGPAGQIAGWSSCADSYPASLRGLGDGTYVFSVRTWDLAGNVSATTTSSYVLDTVAPPAAGVAVSPSPSSGSGPVWTLTTPEAGVTAACRLLRDGTQVEGWAACGVSTSGSTYSVALAGRPDGRYSLEVRLTDAAGNTGPVSGADYVYDTTPPAAVLVTPPSTPGNTLTPQWQLTGEAEARLQCRFGDATTFTTCASAGAYTTDLSQSPDGSYALTVRAVDAAGNVGVERTSTYVLDTSPPLAPVVTGPGAGAAQNRTPTWQWTGEAGTSPQCTLTREATEVWSGPCSTPFAVELPEDGTYLLSVRLVDAAGNVSLAGTDSYVLDTTAPEAPVIVGPSSPSSLQSPAFSFDAESGAVVSCRVSFGADADSLEVDPAGWQICDGGSLQVDAAEEGLYRLEVRATDAAGNTSAVGAYDYVYDAKAPAGLQNLVLPTSPGNALRPEWTWTVQEGSTTTCRLEGPEGLVQSGSCTDGFRPSAPLDLEGRYLLRIVVTDVNGNVGTNDVLYVLDTTGPAAPAVTPVGASGRIGQVQWGWVGDPTATFVCRLSHNGRVVSDWTACTPGTQQLGEWGEGTFVLEVAGVDPVGNRGPAGRGSYTWETAGPAALGVTTASPTTGGPGPVLWVFPVPGDAVTVTCGVRRGGTWVRAMTGCYGSYAMDLTGQRDGTYEVVVLFVDAQGNPTEQVRTYVLDTFVAPRPAPPTGGGGGGGGPFVGPSGPAPFVQPAFRPARTSGTPTTPVQDVVASPTRLITAVTPRAAEPLAPGGLVDLVDAVEEVVGRPGFGIPGGVLSGSAAVDALKDVAGETIRRPQLPIVLLLIVGLFLLVQNRIDRRDPKLAGAPVDAEPELEFRSTPFSSRVGGAPA